MRRFEDLFLEMSRSSTLTIKPCHVLVGCEDLVLESLSADTLVQILHWSREAHGSSWVHRQALHFLKEEFLSIAHSPVLHDLNHSYLLHASKSDFLQVRSTQIITSA